MWNTVRHVDSSDEKVRKYVFEKADAVVEAVLYRYPTYAVRTVICCSTQSGCPVGCRFCGAGDRFARSLTAGEIVSQVAHVLSDRRIDASHVRRLQIMFMSMGEPLLNQRALVAAIRRLHRLHPRADLLVSSVAPRVDWGPFIDVSIEVPAVGLQFSVHESTDEARNRLIPFAEKLTLREIATQGEKWFGATSRKPFFNYCAHDGNTSESDADRLRALFDPDVWEATISVVCERDESVSVAKERQLSLATGFRRLLGERGFNTRVFDPGGQDDIGGGCGQLWFVQDWMRRHPSKVRPSIGRGLPVVHAPHAK